LALVAALVFGWGVFSARLERADLTAPIVFVAAGLLLTHGPLAPLSNSPSPASVRALAEGTLVLVLFTDASRVDLRTLRADWKLYARLLGVGLPLTIGLGIVLALLLFPGMDIWLALLVGAALAPTDAALGARMIVNPKVPARLRRLINVESGLNDGIATPFVTIALAGAASAEHVATHGPVTAVTELAVGLLIGVAVGAAGGLLQRFTRGRGWAAAEFAGPAVLALAACAYASSVALHGNGFIAAFVGGLAFGATARPGGERIVPFVEDVGGLVSLLTWLAFGAVAAAPAFANLNWQIALYAVLSLTVVRMLPVALALAGSGLGRTVAVFVGWFGPRGLASVVFGLLALETLDTGDARPAVTIIGITVMLSVVVHGTSADPLAKRYEPRLAAATTAAVPAMQEMPVRQLAHRAAVGHRRSDTSSNAPP
jgi:NhaP-type Na+/H+ or K+/H+ antiporter